MVQALEKNHVSTSMNAKLIGFASGSGKTIILAHGFGADQSIWDKVLPWLSPCFSVLLFDWNFSGAVKDESLYDPVKYSSYDAFADDLIQLIQDMGLKSTSFVGHSMSGMIGCIASIKRPDLFHRLVLIGASPRYINDEDYEGGFDLSDIDEILSNIATNYDDWASSFASMVVDPHDSLSVHKFCKCLKSMRPAVALSLAKIVFFSDERGILEKVVTPCTIIQTRNDVVVPDSVAQFMKKKMKGNSSIEIVDTDGHFPQLTAHLKLVEVLKGILGLDEN